MTLKYRKPGAKEGKPLNELQRLASSENFAIFTLKGMRGQLNALRYCDTIQGYRVQRLDELMQNLILEIKLEQNKRIQKRKEAKNG